MCNTNTLEHINSLSRCINLGDRESSGQIDEELPEHEVINSPNAKLHRMEQDFRECCCCCCCLKKKGEGY